MKTRYWVAFTRDDDIPPASPLGPFRSRRKAYRVLRRLMLSLPTYRGRMCVEEATS